MHIRQIDIKNFRLLARVRLLLHDRTTLIVGRNNSGKTSLTELFRRLLSEGTPTFRLEDFSLSTHDRFWRAYLLHRGNREEDCVRRALPIIEVKLTITYATTDANLGLLSNFIVDLNSGCTDALIVLRYQLKDGAIEPFFAEINIDAARPKDEQKASYCRALRERVPQHYAVTAQAVDPTDPTNYRDVDFSALRGLVQSGFISAQRGLDDTTHKDMNLLGKVLENLLTTAMKDAADPTDRDISLKLSQAVEGVQAGIDTGFNKQLQNLLPAFTLFGYPGLRDPELRTETMLDVDRLLKNHTRVHYAGIHGIHLPEAYNGLGVRNLVFILLKLYEFFKVYSVQQSSPGIHLVFIEEPEVHLHPQMQEVFIAKLSAIAAVFAEKFSAGVPWPVQFVVTTHSSHLANRADFSCMRYFLATADEQTGKVRATKIKNLDNLGGTLEADREFLHKYLTLTRCDLLFADKAILIEGTAERLLLPKMIDMVDADQPDGSKLASQYISVVEVGGAYAHVFFKLIDFLDLRTLVITDLDSVNREDGGRACSVSQGTHTSNACIRQWLQAPDITPTALIQKPADAKLAGLRRIAYQIPESQNAPCGRSFEDAFMLANPVLFGLENTPANDRALEAWKRAQAVDKADFALDYAINKTGWVVPLYIAEGLRWLRQGEPDSAIPPLLAAGCSDPAHVLDQEDINA